VFAPSVLVSRTGAQQLKPRSMRIFTLRNAAFFAEKVRVVVDPHQPLDMGRRFGARRQVHRSMRLELKCAPNRGNRRLTVPYRVSTLLPRLEHMTRVRSLSSPLSFDERHRHGLTSMAIHGLVTLVGVAAAARAGAVVVVGRGVIGDLRLAAVGRAARVEAAEEHAVLDPLVDIADHVVRPLVVPA
jgi:hypothetical protein